jgi:hypothetical protein
MERNGRSVRGVWLAVEVTGMSRRRIERLDGAPAERSNAMLHEGVDSRDGDLALAGEQPIERR